MGPLLGGVALITLLVVYQYRARRPLLTVRNLNSTIPLSGIVVVVCAAAASVLAVALTGAVLAPHYTPLQLGLLYVPELAGAVITAIAFGMVISRRLLPYFVLAGMVLLAAGILVLRAAVPPTAGLALAGSALVGVGVGASVTPALFLIGFSLRSPSIQRVFAISEMLRAVAAFVVAPVLLHFAVTLTGLPTPAMSTALWICFGLATGGALVGVLLYLLGGVRPSTPALARWMGGREPGWESPPLLAAVRHGPAEHVLGRAPVGAGSDHGSGGRIAAALTSLPHRHAVHGHGDQVGPVVFAYDGSDLAKAAIAEAACNCQPGGTRWSSPSGERSASGSSRSPGRSSTPRAPTRLGRLLSKPPRTEHRWPRRQDSGHRPVQSREHRSGRRSWIRPTTTRQASSSWVPVAVPRSAS